MRRSPVVLAACTLHTVVARIYRMDGWKEGVHGLPPLCLGGCWRRPLSWIRPTAAWAGILGGFFSRFISYFFPVPKEKNERRREKTLPPSVLLHRRRKARDFEDADARPTTPPLPQFIRAALSFSSAARLARRALPLYLESMTWPDDPPREGPSHGGKEYRGSATLTLTPRTKNN